MNIFSLSCAKFGGREGRGERGTRCSSQETQRHKESGQPARLDYIGKSNPEPWAREFWVVVETGMQGEPGCQSLL